MSKSRRRLTFGEQFDLIEKVKSGVPRHIVAKEYGIAERTVCHVIARESYIKTKINSVGYAWKKANVKARNSDVEDALFEWFKQRRDRGEPIGGPIIKEKALELNQQLNGPETFKASCGWFGRFKKRYGIRSVLLKRKSLSNNNPARAAEFSKSFQEKIVSENLNLDNIYSAVDSRILWRLLLEGSLEPAARLQNRTRVTALFCANATGSNRLPLLAIGKSIIPRCLNDLITENSKDLCLHYLESLDVLYTHQTNAWMDEYIFMLWYKDEFIPRVLEHQRTTGITGKVVLLLENTSSHSNLDELNGINENFQVVFFPPNVKQLIQPMDQEVIEVTVKLYKTSYFRRLLLSDKSEGVTKFINEFNLRDFLGMISHEWNELETSLLQKAWKPLLGDLFPVNQASASAKIQDLQSNINADLREQESSTDLLRFPDEIFDQVCELSSKLGYPAEKARDFLLKWFENDQTENEFTWEISPEALVVNNKPEFVSCKSEILNEIVENEDILNNPNPMEVTLLKEPFVEFVSCESKNLKKIEKCQAVLENPEPMEVMSSKENFLEFVSCESNSSGKIERSQDVLEDPEPMEITSSEEAFVCIENVKKWLKSRSEYSLKYMGYIKELENLIAEITRPKITAAEAFDSIIRVKNWLKTRPECLPKHMDYFKELEDVIVETM